ncbi:MAG: hypothetical protein GY906_05375 [bacterium]|nr:hypothetical protein [bacterium]
MRRIEQNSVFWRIGIVVLAVILLSATIASAIRMRNERAELQQLLDETGLAQRRPELIQRVRYEPDTEWARVVIARAIVAEAIDPHPYQGLTTREASEAAAGVRDRLRLAHEMASEIITQRPVSWQAWMLKGASHYILLSLEGSLDVFDDRASWEAPLRRAMTLAPGKDEPQRFLSAAMLEIWLGLSEKDQSEAKLILTRAFEHAPTFHQLINVWLQTAEDLDEALELIPNSAASWSRVQNWYRGQRNWPAFLDTRERWWTCLELEVPLLVDLGEAQLRGGDRVSAGTSFANAVRVSRPDLRFRDDFARAIAQSPAGTVRFMTERVPQEWLDWALEGAVRGEQLLPQGVISRLASARSEQDAPTQALALLAAGRVAEAETIERRREDLNIEPWARYGLTKARIMRAKGDLEAARASLNNVHPSWSGNPVWIDLQQSLNGQANGSQREMWWGTEWRWSEATATLDLDPKAPAESIQIALHQVPNSGAVVEIEIGYQVVWTGEVGPDSPIEISNLPSSGPWLLRFRTLGGGRVIPGDVTLLTVADGDGPDE